MDLIDRKAITEHIRNKIDMQDLYLPIHIIQLIDELPTIDAEPVRKGRWLPDNNCYYEVRFVCSVCKESEIVPTTGFYKYSPIWNYCPNCGAKMEVSPEDL